MNITFINCLLTPPQLERLPISWQELCDLITSLSSSKLAEFRRLRSLVDLDNLRAHWSQAPLNPCGNWTAAALAANPDEVLTPFFQKALRSGGSEEVGGQFSSLTVEFFAADASQFGQSNWISRYFRAELAMRWTLATLRAKGLGQTLDRESASIERAGVWDFLNRTLQSARADWPSFLSQIEEIYRDEGKKPLDLWRALNQRRLQLIEDLAAELFLDWERILAISAQSMICADWQRMSRERGLQALRRQRAEDLLTSRGKSAQ